MTKEQAIRWAGNGMKLARLLGITRQAISLWPAGEPIPLLRQYQIDELKRSKRSANGNPTPRTAA
jgi:hypothetical protein